MSQQNGDLAALRRRVFGRGVQCDRIDPTLDLTRDVVLRRGPDGLDLAQVSDVDNLRQCLEVALTTLLGSDVFNTAFGFDGMNALAEETNAILMRERVRISLIQVLQREPRVRRIVDLKLLDGRLTRHGSESSDESDPVERWRTIRADVAFETVAGDTVVMNLGKVLANA